MIPPYDATEQALNRVAYAARKLAEQGYSPGADVSLYRALRELHRCLNLDGSQDPHRLIRGLLFRGLAEMEDAR